MRTAYLLIFLSSFLFTTTLAPAEGTKGAPKSKISEVKKTKKRVYKKKKKKKRAKVAKRKYINEIYFGHVIYIDPSLEFIFVKPINPRFARKIFYVDRRTKYSLPGRKSKKKEDQPTFLDIVEGQKVAVNYIGHGKLALADTIFVVKGEFEPEQYLTQKKRRKRRKKKEET